MFDPLECLRLNRRIALVVQFSGNLCRGEPPVAEHQNTSGQSIDNQWLSSSAPGTPKSDDITWTGSRYCGKVRASSRAEEIRHLVIEHKDAELRVSNRRQR